MRSYRFLVFSCFLAICATSEAARVPVLPPPSPIYLNLEPIEPPAIPPQIDALAFENRSLFVVQDSAFLLSNPTLFLLIASGSSLYQGQSVLSWKNSGTMVGVPGFRFETLPDVRRLPLRQRRKPGAYLPKPAQLFLNEGDIIVGTQLFIRATNIFNPGRLEGDLGSRISLLAPNGSADLSRGAIRIGRIATPFAPPPLFFFTLDPELVTLYAATGTNGLYNRSNLPHLFLPSAFTPLTAPTNVPGITNINFGQPRPPFYEALVNPTLSGLAVTFRLTNFLSGVPTCGNGYASFAEVTDFGFGLGKNVTVAFVETNSLVETNIAVDVRFLNSFFFTGPTIAVEYRSLEFDIIEQRLQTNFLTFLDTGSILRMPPPTNVLSIFPSPSNYQLVRGRVAGFEVGSPGNTPFSPSLFYDANFITNQVPYQYSAVSLQLGPPNLSVASPFFSPFFIGLNLGLTTVLADPTNFPSRVEITAKNLNLDRARIRAEQAIDIHATNLVANSFAMVDAPFVNFDVGTTNQTLIISNLAPAVVNRASGQISAYSATWRAMVTNQLTGLAEPVNFHVLIMGNCLQFSQPVVLHRFFVQATNLVVEDSLFVNNGFKVNSESVTFSSNVVVQLPIKSNWAFTNVMNVSHFTNFGVLNVPGSGAYFGAAPSGYVVQPPRKRKKPKNQPILLEAYDDFVNHGVVFAASLSIDTEFLESSGTALNPAFLVATNGPILINANLVNINNTLVSAAENFEIRANDIVIDRTEIRAGSTNFIGGGRSLPGTLIIAATNSLHDGGLATSNQWQVTGGVRMLRKPKVSGDLFGTTITSLASTFTQPSHTWAGTNLGVSVEGFTNNLALGRLVLDGTLANRFRFSGAAPNSALYVEYLELRNYNSTNYDFALDVDPGFVVYFADSNVEPDKLEGLSGGRIRWVSDFAGPRSSTNLVYPNGLTYTFNAALVRSFNRDDDGDTTPNNLDCTPIPVPGVDTTERCPFVPLASQVKTAGQETDLQIALTTQGTEVVLSWNAAANSANSVEFSESLAGGGWQSLTNFINGPVDARVTVRDAATAPLRVYRVRVDAGKP